MQYGWLRLPTTGKAFDDVFLNFNSKLQRTILEQDCRKCTDSRSRKAWPYVTFTRRDIISEDLNWDIKWAAILDWSRFERQRFGY